MINANLAGRAVQSTGGPHQRTVLPVTPEQIRVTSSPLRKPLYAAASAAEVGGAVERVHDIRTAPDAQETARGE